MCVRLTGRWRQGLCGGAFHFSGCSIVPVKHSRANGAWAWYSVVVLPVVGFRPVGTFTDGAEVPSG